ncbi:LacI family DNA-binding transcriptional regulator [Litorihabitans aurantiacus]|uniref:LacI family DNA-binding transcriptional regulator n=1 Tax=Litorihabitans aurantiacus TaxID=1930061 RepID=UPI0024E071CD|nr:LacI family DNA-binding transcriptional regulator [Litorihabitans aurantiacus]
MSIATASRALSGSGVVSPALTTRVLEAVDALRYTVNPHARSLAGGATSVIGLMVYEIDDPYFGEIAGGVIQVAGGAAGACRSATRTARPPATSPGCGCCARSGWGRW